MAIIAGNLSYTYMKGTPFEKEALKDINLEIKTGEFVGLIGHTGSGKSTLVQHFNGLLKPTSGIVTVNGVDTRVRSLKELRKQVGIVFQYPEHQLFEETVYDDIAFGLKRLGLDDAAVEERVRETVKVAGIPEDVLEKSPFELSGGQKRRVAIAGVIAMNPEILVLDEPVAGLDPEGRDGILGFISKLHEKRGITVILVSHSMEDIARYAKRIVVMNNGMIEMDGCPAEVFKDVERLEQMGLSAPQITYFMKKLKKLVPETNNGIFLISDAKREIARLIEKKREALHDS